MFEDEHAARTILVDLCIGIDNRLRLMLVMNTAIGSVYACLVSATIGWSLSRAVDFEC